MAKAARAIIIKDGKLLVMHRDKSGAQYFTLVGGRIKDNESTEQGLVREVREETGLEVTSARLVYIEEHAPPYDEQYIYLCEISGTHGEIAVQTASEEGFMNQIGINNHQPMWVELRAFPRIQFRTPQLQAAITEALKSGFPSQPVKL